MIIVQFAVALGLAVVAPMTAAQDVQPRVEVIGDKTETRIPNPFVGKWTVTWESNRPYQATVVLDESGGGTWRTLVTTGERKNDYCNGLKVPVVATPTSTQSVRLSLRFAETLAGCSDARVDLFQMSDGSIVGRRKTYPLKLVKD